MSYDFLLKFIVIGSAGVGKSSLLSRFVDDTFEEASVHTIGVEFFSRICELGAATIKLQVWDTAGQERFRSVTRSYYRGAAAAILVYDVTSRDSFNSLSSWLSDTRDLAHEKILVILVGNKCDLEDERQVSFLEASQFAQENEIKYLETSAYTGDNVEQAFLTCARSILVGVDSGAIVPGPESGVLANPSGTGSDAWAGGAPAASGEGCQC